MSLEVQSIYRKFADIVKKVGLTEDGEHAKDSTLFIDETLTCRNQEWFDRRGFTGSLSLSAFPHPVDVGYIELTMRVHGRSNFAQGLGVIFAIESRGVSCRMEEYHPVVDMWTDTTDPFVKASDYEKQLLRTGEILTERYTNEKAKEV